MAGVKGRTGRPPKMELDWFNQVADLTFRQAYFLLRDESVPLLDRVRVCLPVALKRIPDKIEQKLISLNVSDELLYRVQSLLEQRRDQSSQPIDTKQVTAVPTEFNVVDDSEPQNPNVGAQGGG